MKNGLEKIMGKFQMLKYNFVSIYYVLSLIIYIHQALQTWVDLLWRNRQTMKSHAVFYCRARHRLQDIEL